MVVSNEYTEVGMWVAKDWEKSKSQKTAPIVAATKMKGIELK